MIAYIKQEFDYVIVIKPLRLSPFARTNPIFKPRITFLKIRTNFLPLKTFPLIKNLCEPHIHL